MPPLIKLTDVSKEYQLGKQTVRALRNVTLSVEPQDFVAIAGPSGSGKSSLLNIIGCMDSPTAGAVLFDGEPVHSLSERRLTEIRLRKLGFIFQGFNLVPVLNVFRNVELPLVLQGGMTRAQRAQRVVDLLAAVGLGDHHRHRPLELSGGQQQRVAIARALVSRPAVVLADEPTANLDSETGRLVLDLMRRLHDEQKTTFVFSTHDPEIMAKAARLVEIRDGAIVSDETRNVGTT